MAISISALAAGVGLLLVLSPGGIVPAFVSRLTRRPVSSFSTMGPKELGLRTELRVKIGMGIIVWCSALVLSLLLRLLGTSGLILRVLPMIVLLALPFLAGYAILYRFAFYPQLLKRSRLIDACKTYEAAIKEAKAREKKSGLVQARTVRSPRICLVPTEILLGAILAPLLYYLLVMLGNIRFHDPRQIGALVIGLIGYLIGLEISLGSDLRLGWFGV